MLDVIIDISHHNTITSFAAIKNSGCLGIIHKASQGVSFIDQAYKDRKQAAKASGLLWGAYHFGECGNPQEQAHRFLHTTQPEPTDLLVLDFEPCGNTMGVEDAEIFVRIVAEQTGRLPGLYSGQSFLTECLDGLTQTVLRGCWLWIARYSTQVPVVPPLWETWSMWQFCDDGTVPGVAGPVDRDRFNGTLENLYRLWGVPAPTSQA